MGFRSVIISNPANLSLKNNNLIIANKDEFQIPVEDISVLLIESPAVKLTAKLISKLSEYSVATIICDDKHLPSSIVLPLNIHYKSYKVLKDQFSLIYLLLKKKIERNIKALEDFY